MRIDVPGRPGAVPVTIPKVGTLRNRRWQVLTDEQVEAFIAVHGVRRLHPDIALDELAALSRTIQVEKVL
jgi:hypothetical protein